MESPIKWIRLDDIQLWLSNPNDGNVGQIAESIREFGMCWPISWRDSNVTKAGNHRVKALWALRNETLPDDKKWQPSGACIRVVNNDVWEVMAIDHSALTEAQSDAFALADNRTVRLGHDDPQKLLDLLEQAYGDESIRLEATGYSAEDIDDLLKRVNFESFIPELKAQASPELESEHLITIHCSKLALDEIMPLLAKVDEHHGATVNIS